MRHFAAWPAVKAGLTRPLAVSAGCALAVALLVLLPLSSASPHAQPGGQPGTYHRPLDQILDVNVRDGMVYATGVEESAS